MYMDQLIYKKFFYKIPCVQYIAHIHTQMKARMIQLKGSHDKPTLLWHAQMYMYRIWDVLR